MRKVRTRIGSILLVTVMLLSLMPATALAGSVSDCSGGAGCAHEAAIGTTHYDTIGEAIDAANKTSGNDTITVTLLKDATLQLDYTKQKAILKNMILDMGGHTLTYAGVYGFTVNYNVTFELKNGTYKNTDTEGTGIQAFKQSYTGPGCTIIIAEDATVEAYDGIMTVGHTVLKVYGTIKGTRDAIFGSGPKNNVTLDGAHIEAGAYGVYQQGNDGGSSYDIKNSTITTPNTEGSCAVFISNNKADAEDTVNQGMQTLNIENSVISGQDGIEVRYTNVTISGDQTEVTSADDGYALGVTHNGNESAVGTLSIAGGTFKGDIGFMAGEKNTATLNITGGTFTDDVSGYVQPGMMQDENGQIIQVVATFGEKNYGTLAEAIKAANNAEDGGTVSLLKNATLSTALDDNVTLSVNSSATLTVETNGLTNLTKGTLEIQQGGGLIFGSDKLVDSTDGALKLTSGTVTMANGTVTLTGGSKAEIPTGQTFYLMLGTNGPALNADIEKDAVLTVKGTLKAVSGSGESGSQVTVKGTLDVKGTLTIAQKADVTVESGGTLNLPAMTKETMGSSNAGKGMKGDIIVNSGAHLTYANNDVLGGDNPLMTLTDGTATLNLGNANNTTAPSVSLTLNGTASVASNLKALWVTANGQNTFVPMAITVASGSDATVPAGKVLNLVNGSSLTVEDTAKFEVAGILEVHSTAKFDDNATVSGKVYVFEATNGTNPISGAAITLTNTGAVYAERTELTETTITPAQMMNSEETYPSTSATGDTTFAKQWTFSCKITLDANGGALTGETTALRTGTDGKLTAMPQDPTYSGYTFLGWYDAATSGNEVDTNTVFNADATIYAQWSKNSTGGGGGGGVTTYAVTLPTDVANGTISVSPKNAAKNATVTLTVTPDEGYQLATLTVTDKNGKAVELTKKSDTQYTFKMPASKVSVQVSFTQEEAPVTTLPFTDVSTNDWFYEAVAYAYENGMMNGVAEDRFAPASNLTRGMITQVLYNLEGNPPAGSGSFTDVADGQWYADAVNWAAANDIVGGYGNGKFGPENNITREQMAQILYNYAIFKGYDVSAQGDLSAFSDGAKTSDWALTAMQWAVGTGLLQGYNGTLNPTGTATRAEVAQIFMNFCENIVK